MSALALAIALAAAAPDPTATSTTAPAPTPTSTATPNPANTEKIRAELTKAMDRELSPLPARPFKTLAGVEGTVEGAAAPTVKAEGDAEEVEVSLGTGQALSCTIFPVRLDAAAAVWRYAEQAKRSVTVTAATPVGAAVVAGSPVVFAILVYRVDGPKGPLVGMAKLGVYAHDAHSLLCVHDELGYGKSFERIVKGLAGSLRGGVDDARAGARFAEVELMRIGELAIGVSERVVWDREGGGHVVKQRASQLLPRGGADLYALDSTSEEVVDAKDLLEQGVYSHAANGEIDAAMQLTRAQDGVTYRYEGEKDGKRLEGTFATKAGLSTDLWFARRLQAKAPPAKPELRHEAYSLEASPVAALPVVYRLDPAAGPRRVRMELGPIQLGGELDADGLVRLAEIPVGSAKLTVERAWSRGTP
jgi:hypothetical protein